MRNLLRLTNRKARLLVGLLLAGLFCVQCTRMDATPESHAVTVIAGVPSNANTSALLQKLEGLARTDHIAFLKECLHNYDQAYKDYTCQFLKQERIGGELGKEQVLEIKFREDPYSVVMTWIKNKPLGEKIIYVEGKYDNMMLVKPNSSIPFAALAGTLRKDPQGEEARKYSLRTVNQFGFKRSMLSLVDVYEQAKAAGDLKQEYGGYVNFEGRQCIELVRYLPDSPKYPAYRTLTYVDTQYLVPLCVQGYDSDDKLVSSYVYRDIRFNLGLNSDQFEPKANGMSDPK